MSQTRTSLHVLYNLRSSTVKPGENVDPGNSTETVAQHSAYKGRQGLDFTHGVGMVRLITGRLGDHVAID